jgi:hypothetical protein
MRQACDAARIVLCTALLLATQVAGGAQAQGAMTGRVTDQALNPVSNAEVEIGEIRARTRTDSTGRFEFRGIPSGQVRVHVRRLGFAPESMEVRVVDHDVVDVQIRLVRRAQLLPEVPVEDTQPPVVDRKLKDFERRRSSGVGQFLTGKDLAPERSRPLGDVVGRLRGTYVVRSATAACLTATRGSQSFQNTASGWCGSQWVGGSYCPVAVFVDGYPSYSGDGDEVFNLNTMHADEVAGIEYYVGAGTLPREFSAPRGTCGALVIWTKR